MVVIRSPPPLRHVVRKLTRLAVVRIGTAGCQTHGVEIALTLEKLVRQVGMSGAESETIKYKQSSYLSLSAITIYIYIY